MALVAGQILENKYRIERPLAQGAMGAVFVAENTLIQRRVAIKVLHGDVAANETWVKRFINEAQAAGQIGSEHIVEILDVGKLPDGSRFMVMEYLEGETLRDLMKARGRLRPEEIGTVLLELVDGLQDAHAKGIVHRDLKPANVFLQRRRGKPPRVKILDFGISKFNQMAGEEAQMTRTGAMMGTPYYMSPEQVRASGSVDGRADLYAVGVILFEALVGKVPINAPTLPELMFKICFEPMPHPRSVMPDVDPAIADIVARAMERDPAARFQTALEMHQALSAFLASRSHPAHWAAMSPPHATGSQPFGASPGPGSGAWYGSSPSLSAQSYTSLPHGLGGPATGGFGAGAGIPGSIAMAGATGAGRVSVADATGGSSIGAVSTGALGDVPRPKAKGRIAVLIGACVALGVGGVVAAVVVVGGKPSAEASTAAGTAAATTAAVAGATTATSVEPATTTQSPPPEESEAPPPETSEPVASEMAAPTSPPATRTVAPPNTVAVAPPPATTATTARPTTTAPPKTTGKAISDFGY